MDMATVRSGSIVSINIKQTNTSDHDVGCGKAYNNSGAVINYQYHITGPAGKPASKRIWKHPEFEGAGSYYPCMLGPGQSTPVYPSRISSLFDMTKPGKYTVQVLTFAADRTIVQSNKIQITVTP